MAQFIRRSSASVDAKEIFECRHLIMMAVRLDRCADGKDVWQNGLAMQRNFERKNVSAPLAAASSFQRQNGGRQ
jgi:hypothetical protein